MSLFGSMMGDFEDDPIFGNQMRSMNMHMRHINRLVNNSFNMMPDPFNNNFNMMMPFDSGFGPMAHPHPHQRNPMGMFGFPMPSMNRLMSADIGGGGGGSYCSSSVVSMTSGPDGRPQVYQATSSTKVGPNGVRETRKTVQDSASGVKKMAIGHHIGERAHIIEKEQNLHSGDREERQEFINLDEEEAEEFDREFINKSRMGAQPEMITNGPYRHNLPAIQAAPTSPVVQAPPAIQAPASSPNTRTVTGTATTTTAPSSSTSSSTSRRANRSMPLANPRRSLRTPSSSPLALTSQNISSSLHPHPYNVSARKTHRASKHSKTNNNNLN